MHRILLSATVALAIAGPASAAINFNFTPGGSSPGVGYTLIDTFDDMSGIDAFANAQIKTPPADGDGAPPANSMPSGTAYLSVLGGGFATINFGGAGVRAFQFDWGSLDTYNTLTLYKVGGGSVDVIPGTNLTSPADGNQVLPGTNGLFTAWGTGGDRFSGFRMSSSGNSAEMDNLAVAGVPEPATWAMMIMGFGAAGAVLRRRKIVFA